MRRIIVDSGSSIKRDERERYGVDILPIQLQMGEASFLDGVDLSSEEFYRRLRERNNFPKTSIPSLEVVMRLALALDTTPDTFLTGSLRFQDDQWRDVAEMLRGMTPAKLSLAKSFLSWLANVENI